MSQAIVKPPRTTDIDLSVPPNFRSMKGKTIAITGGASGFGKAMALLWASKGAFVIIGDLNEKAGIEVAREMRKISGSRLQHYVHLDVTSWSSQANFFKRASTLSPSGRVDIVIANAGITESGIDTNFKAGTPGAPPVKPNLKTMDVNSKGVIYTAHLAYWAFSQGPSPSPSEPPRTHHLLLIGSMASFLPGPDTPLYTASKHSVLGLFRVLKSPTVYAHKLTEQQQEIQKRGYRVHVNLLCPYFADTPLIHALEGQRPKLTDSGIQLVTVEDVVIAASRLVTDESEEGGGRAIVVATEQIARGQGVAGTYQMKEIRSRL